MKHLFIIFLSFIIVAACSENVQEVVKEEEVVKPNDLFLGFTDRFSASDVEMRVKKLTTEGRLHYWNYWIIKDSSKISVHLNFSYADSDSRLFQISFGHANLTESGHTSGPDRRNSEQLDEERNYILNQYREKYQLEFIINKRRFQNCLDEAGAPSLESFDGNSFSKNNQRVSWIMQNPKPVPDGVDTVFFNAKRGLIIRAWYGYNCEDNASRIHLKDIKVSYNNPASFYAEMELRKKFTDEELEKADDRERKRDSLKRESEKVQRIEDKKLFLEEI